MLCFVLITSVLLNLLCVWIRQPRTGRRTQDARRKTFYWINSTCSFQGGNWTHSKCRFILHKTVTDCSIKNRLSTVVHFRSKFTSQTRFKSNVHLSFTSITFIFVEHREEENLRVLFYNNFLPPNTWRKVPESDARGVWGGKWTWVQQVPCRLWNTNRLARAQHA